MTKHSKNTASSVFSYAEYKKAGKEYGSRRQRLGNESMRRFDACALCLNAARDPVACAEGHLFCKECAYTDLLTQKRDIKRQKDRLDALKKDADEERARARAAARARVLADFERGTLGLAAPAQSNTSAASEPRGVKRKFEFDTDAVARLAREAEEAALRQIEREQADALKSKLPDFWLPSLTPTYASAGPPRSLQDVKLQTTCRGGEPAHALARKHLSPVDFSTFSSPDGAREKMCPACKKGLSTSTRIFHMRPCAHVVCKTCTDALVRPAQQCVVCDTPLGAEDVVELRREGTGFAGGGRAETVRTGTAFQG
ncbi:hypothetical protein HDZ31DRAFT_30142 [Schizophyllum fasciatum]